jgi:hypothetical protein
MSDDGYSSSAEEDGGVEEAENQRQAQYLQQQRAKALVFKTHKPEIVLFEQVDREVLLFLVGNPTLVDLLDKSDDKILYGRLLQYAQRLREDDTVEVCYEQADSRAGRYYAQGPSLQSFPRLIREALTYGVLNDFDIKDCAPTMLLTLAQRHDMPCQLLAQYVNNREEHLAELQQKCKIAREDAEELLQAVVSSGGNGCLHGDVQRFLQPLAQELKDISNQLMQIYAKYKKAGAGLSLLLHDLEAWCMQIALEELQEFGCSALIHDGVLTQEQVPPEAAERCSAAIASLTGFKLVFEHKPFEPPEWDQDERKLFKKGSKETVKRTFSSYEQVKAEWEKTHFKLQKPAKLIEVDLKDWSDACDMMTMFTSNEMKNHFNNLYYYTIEENEPEKGGDCSETDDDTAPRTKRRKKSSKDKKAEGRVTIKDHKFIDKWLDDEDMKTYHHVDFLPPPLHVPDNVFNTWRGFKVQFLPPATEEDVRLMEEWILPLVKDVVCASNEAANTWVTNYLAQLFQSPGQKTDLALVLLGIEGGYCYFYRYYYYLLLLMQC